ncbi:glycosyltransferase, partial [Akkermansia sp.]
EYKNEVLREIERAGVSHAFTWTGHRQDLRDIISTCSVTLSLTKSPEAFGKSTLEALALGRPVAGYAHGGVKEQLDAFLPEGNIAVGDTSSMAALLSRWYAQPPPLPRHIPSPYKMEDMIQAHLDVYQELTPYS